MRTRIFRFSEKLKKARITSQISLLTKQTHFNRLSVFCLFAPSPQKYKSIFWGPLTLKSQNFDEIVVFSAGFENSSVLWRTRIFKFRRKSKISQNYDFLIKAGFKSLKLFLQLLREPVAELLIEFLNAFGFFLPGFGIDVK